VSSTTAEAETIDYTKLSIKELTALIMFDTSDSRAVAQLGVALYNADQQTEAVPYLSEALRRMPADHVVLANLGAALNAAGFPSAALSYLRQSIRLEPRLLEAHLSLAFALLRLQRPQEALQAVEQAQALDPKSVPALVTAAQILQFLGRLHEAEACCHMAICLDPDHAAAHFEYGLVLLQLGNYECGWEEFEWRFQAKRSVMRSFDCPQWRGEDIRGKHLLVWLDQGLGDTIQFSRYFRILAERAAKITVELSDLRLHRFIQEAGAGWTTDVKHLAPYDYHIPICSLAGVMGTRLNAIPGPVDLKIDRPRREDGPLKVGLCWQGSRSHPWDMYRSVPAMSFAGIAQTNGAEFYSLQSGEGAERWAEVSPSIQIMATAGGDDILDLAQRIATLDLVITVDTAIAHLAATVGVETWMLCGANSEWRWLSDRTDSPWYPAMRIYRQRAYGKWDDVLRDVRIDLGTLKRQRQGEDATGSLTGETKFEHLRLPDEQTAARILDEIRSSDRR